MISEQLSKCGWCQTYTNLLVNKDFIPQKFQCKLLLTQGTSLISTYKLSTTYHMISKRITIEHMKAAVKIFTEQIVSK
jgi:hypothetical protein